MNTVKAKYTCNACGDEEIEVTVRERFPNESVESYIDATARVLGEVHELRNPFCQCRKVDVYVPMGVNKEGTIVIGFSDVRELTDEECKEVNEALKRPT